MAYGESEMGSAQDMTPRQIRMNALWAWYCCVQYENRKIDWNGMERLDFLDFEAASSIGYVPDGMQVVDGDSMPLKMRKPTAPYNMPKVVVDRFTAMLFSARRHPKFASPSEPDSTEGWCNAVAEAGRLFSVFSQARTFGGAEGTAVVGFSFVDNEPRFETHDPRNTFPIFKARSRLEYELESLEMKYPFTREIWKKEKRRYEQETFWYRRVVDEERDTVFIPLSDKDYREAIQKGNEPPWQPQVDSDIQHKLGFCPMFWIQNTPEKESIDGQPDCAGIYETCEAIDALYAQANRGILNNCDPTLAVKTDADMDDVKLGSDNILKLDEGGDAKFLEIQAGGIKAARELANEFRERALEVVSCVLDDPEVGDRATATEVERKYAAMLAKCDVLREQYGEMGVLRVMRGVIRAAKKVGPETIKLPPKVTTQPDGSIKKEKHVLGDGDDLHLKWKQYFIPSLNDAKMAADTVLVARQAEVVDKRTGIRFFAEYVNSDRVDEIEQALEQEADRKKAEADEAMQKEIDAKVQVAKATISTKDAPSKSGAATAGNEAL